MSDFLSVLFLALGLSADAFAVAVCKGLSLRRRSLGASLYVGAWFGFFQAVMPLLGFLLAGAFAPLIATVGHWICFALLTAIGLHMLAEAFSDETVLPPPSLAPAVMLAPALASSIDAMAAGAALSLSGAADILPTVGAVGAVTWLLSALGVYIGGSFGAVYRAKAEGFGGILLVFLGIKILISDLLSSSGVL